jgi:hypothetical protein
MNKRMPSITAGLIGGLVIGAFGFSLISPSQATTQSKSICVNETTKELKLRKNCKSNETFVASASVLTQGGKSAYDTWLELGNSGTKAEFIQSLIGPRGASGSSSMGQEFLRTCFQKREAALNSNMILSNRLDRNYFERQTGCIVEQIKNEQSISTLVAAGYPVATSWTLLSTTPITVVTQWNGSYGLATYKVKVANWDAVSALGSQAQLCVPRNNYRYFSRLQQIDGDEFQVQVRLYSTDTSLSARMNIGIVNYRERYVGFNNRILESYCDTEYGQFYIHEDPEKVHESYHQPGWQW